MLVNPDDNVIEIVGPIELRQWAIEEAARFTKESQDVIRVARLFLDFALEND